MEVKKSKKTISFEEALQNLESIVQALEAGEVPLAELVEKYQEGIRYHKLCQEHLERAEMVLESVNEKGERVELALKLKTEDKADA